MSSVDVNRLSLNLVYGLRDKYGSVCMVLKVEIYEIDGFVRNVLLPTGNIASVRRRDL